MTDEYDRQQGTVLIKEAAEAGPKAARYTLVNLYADGKGCIKRRASLVLFHKGAESDSALIMNILARVCLNGKPEPAKSPSGGKTDKK